MQLPGRVETVIVGGGQAGLTMSWFLSQAGRDHIVLERRGELGGGWLDRWDGFRLVTPNWSASFPGAPYEGADPDGFMRRDEIASRVAGYAARIEAPVLLETEVHRLSVRPGGGFGLDTSGGSIVATGVIVATGSYHIPRIPPVGADMPARLTQLHSHAYRSEARVPPGAVLVVGTGQSGVQIAEELAGSGRRVLVSVGTAGRVPRRYRGRDFFAWFRALAVEGEDLGVQLPTVDTLPDSRIILAGNPALSGHGGGHETNLRQFAADGMTMLGRIERVDGERVTLAGDLAANLARADAFFDERLRPLIDRFIKRADIDAPPDDRERITFEPPALESIDLADEGVSTVIWASGYQPDFGWIDLPIFDTRGWPLHRRGVSQVRGLSFLGLHWQHMQTSATLLGVPLDARYLAADMGLTASAGAV